MTTTLRGLIQGSYYWRATIETDGLIYAAQTVFPVTMAKGDVVKTIADKCPDIVIDDGLAALMVRRG
jgi:hypothetical protein